jgi:hypothetical protein
MTATIGSSSEGNVEVPVKVRQQRQLLAIFVVAVLFSYPWELAQSPLYAGMGHFSLIWWHCFIASGGDGLLVLLIFLAGWLALHRRDWIDRPGIRGYVLMLAVGGSIGVGVEWVAVHVMGEWAYTAQMPLVPGLGVGVVPVAQMLVLPPLIFRIVAVWRRRASKGPYN